MNVNKNIKQKFIELFDELSDNQLQEYYCTIYEQIKENSLELKDLTELKNKNFLIPDYQRGYRWGKDQIKDLINDLSDFYKNNQDNNLCYCLQPIIVKDIENEKIEIIDGQQRLTTLKFILKEIKSNINYQFFYETRENIENNSKKTIDDRYKEEAEEVIKKELKDDKKKENIKELIKNQRLKFLWYKIRENTSPNDIFARVNDGKIPLTQSELCKALLLTINKNFEKNDGKFEQYKKAYKWDEIENNLEDDEFWYFLINKDDEKIFESTKIDLLFKLFKEINSKDAEKKDIDEFKYIEKNLNNLDNQQEKGRIWNEIISYYQILREWYEDQELYHLVGYYICINKNKSIEILAKLINNYKSSEDCKDASKGKKAFIKHLKEIILKDFKNDFNNYIKKHKTIISNEKKFFLPEINYDYDKKSKSNNILIVKLLLFFNVSSLIDKELRFSFFKYKSEKYDIEHIHPSHEKEDINDENKEKLRESLNDFVKELKSEGIIIEDNEDENGDIYKIFEKINDKLSIKNLKSEYKNCIGNLTLLNRSINRSFKNDFFIQKRKRIIESLIIHKKRENLDDLNSKFKKEYCYILPCTEKAFLKFYSNEILQNDKWDENDCEEYIKEMVKQLNYTLETRIFRYKKILKLKVHKNHLLRKRECIDKENKNES